MTYLGWANGLSCTAITNTKLAPNGGINQIFVSSIELKYDIKKIHKKAPRQDIKVFVLSLKKFLNFLLFRFPAF